MANPTLTVGGDFLLDRAIDHVSRVYANPGIQTGTKLHSDLEWQPAFFFKIANFTTVAMEVSESVYPVILQRKRSSVEDVPFPVCVYSVCPEEEYQARLDDAKELISAGFGLITIDGTGRPHVWQEAPPLQQIITRGQYEPEVENLPRSLQRRLAESYRRYAADPLSGVRDVTEVFEESIRKVGQAAQKDGHLAKIDPTVDALDNVVEHLTNCQLFAKTKRVFYSARGYILERNENHHPPNSAKAAAKRLRDTRHAFLEGLKQIDAICASVTEAGLKVRYPQ